MMMSEEHTDNLFKELDRFDIQPSEQVWANIDARLGQKKKEWFPCFGDGEWLLQYYCLPACFCGCPGRSCVRRPT